jgi:sec-independent protein translocase protein TatA
MFAGALQPMHLVLILVIVLIIFGPGKLPDLGKSLGKGIAEFKKSTSGDYDEAKTESATATAVADAPKTESATATAVADAPKVVCAACKKENPAGQQFCGGCGTALA